jgi:nucleotide-binding universal stress UspA family protein
MKQPNQSPSESQERKPGRSFHDSSRALGDELLEKSASTTAPTTENFEDRARQAAKQAAADPSGVAQRAKVIAVLRKAEEFMSTSAPAANTDAGVRRALELAVGRMGLTLREYRALADADPELVELERQVITDCRLRWGLGESPVAPLSKAEERAAEELEENETVTLFERVFVPIDFTMESHRALAVALELRRAHGSALCVFHAAESTGSDDWLAGIGSPSVGGDWVTEAKERLRRFLTNVVPGAGEGIEVRSCLGSPVRMLCEQAHLWRATLVVATASLHARIFRSPAEKLLRELALPVLIIPI